MTNESVNDKCDKTIEAINNCGLANFISDEKRNSLVSEVLTLKSEQDLNLASKLGELHENNLKHYIQTKKSTPEYSQDFVKLQIECISLLNEIEAALYIQGNLKP